MYGDMDEDCRYWMARGASILQNPSAHCAQVPENPNGRVREGYRRELVGGAQDTCRSYFTAQAGTTTTAFAHCALLD